MESVAHSPPRTKRRRPTVRFSRVPQGITDAGAWRIEREQKRGTVTDVLNIDENTWRKARHRWQMVEYLARQEAPLAPKIRELARMSFVSPRSLERWLRIYRRNPDIMALMPRVRGPSLGHRRIIPEREKLLQDVIDDWARAGQRLPVTWIEEECRRRGRRRRVTPPSRSCIEARLRDRSIESLSRRRIASQSKAVAAPPRTATPLRIVQIDHTLVDVMVVDELLREAMGRPWITVAFDIATRCVLGFHLSLHAPSAVSVGLTLAMAGLPKTEWLAERSLDIDWPMHGLPRVLHLDNGADFHSVALTRGCDRYGISLEYRPPGKPHFGGHIERYLGTLMRRIHGLPGTTYSSPIVRGKYKSEAKATMTMSELERWVALEIGGRYHFFVNKGVHAVPHRLWTRAKSRLPADAITDPTQFLIDFLPAETRKIRRDGFQMNRIRYWDPVVARLFPIGTAVLARYNPRDLSKVFIPLPDQKGYLNVPYADLRRPPITLAELERARSMLAAKGDAQPTENVIFKATGDLRRIEDAAARSTRKARRQRAQRPPPAPIQNVPDKAPSLKWDTDADPYEGENW